MSAPIGHLRPDEYSDFEPLAFVDQKWADRALCAQVDPEIWFPEKGMPSKNVKAVCARCPVTAECLSWATVTNQWFGIWGGLSTTERDRIRRHAGEVAA